MQQGIGDLHHRLRPCHPCHVPHGPTVLLIPELLCCPEHHLFFFVWKTCYTSVCTAVCVLQRSNGVGRAMWGFGPLSWWCPRNEGRAGDPHMQGGASTSSLSPAVIFRFPSCRLLALAQHSWRAFVKTIQRSLWPARWQQQASAVSWELPPFFWKGPPLFS